MMTEWEDQEAEELQELLLAVDHEKMQGSNSTMLEPPKAGWFGRLVGRLYLAYWRWAYRNHPH